MSWRERLAGAMLRSLEGYRPVRRTPYWLHVTTAVVIYATTFVGLGFLFSRVLR
jgi:hypothetical protein